MRETINDLLVTYYEELVVKQDLALWLFSIMTFSAVGFLAIQHMTQHGTVAEAEEMEQVFRLGVYVAFGVAFGAPALSAVGKVVVLPWYKNRRGVDG